jgi:DNA polymerase-3 subunit delta
LICEATALDKCIGKSPKIFFIFGSEIILRNQARDKIINFYKKDGFDIKKVLNKQSYSDIEMEIMQSAGGTFLASKTIIEIIHDKGKIPKEIVKIFDSPNLNQWENIIILIKSSLDKINKTTKWVKKMDDAALLIDCRKLKTFEEKIWINNQLNFMQKEHAKDHVDRIIDMFSGNLIAQANEVNILKLTYQKDGGKNKSDADGAEFLPYEFEDKIIELNTNYALRIIKSIKRNDDNSGPLMVWIIGKIINISISAHQNKNKRKSLENSGVWSNKIPMYLEFIKQNTLQKIMPLQKKVYKLDLAAKGLAGTSKDQFWQELDNMIIQLTSN